MPVERTDITPTYLWAQLADDRLTAGFIARGTQVAAR